ncbi:hypothetical protein ACM39_05245 [Chryseobacterium sp. FH2]|uniref:tetratricopeptide repeat protein n=1 Tax=Chryseobacterium sp. FH2 TaxID=1674291 RepID=UPI00065AF574|nr:tetratricopeptide repeat protein [Chryseobacterium sp. FH2]KMQ68702.1 hypothetical protein ACM39_05245 [Chryseobacterium sp. FH2]
MVQINRLLPILLLCIFYSVSAKKFDKHETTRQLWFVSNELINSGKFEEVILLNNKLINECKENDYKAGLVMGYYNIGNALSMMGEYKRSLFYLDIAMQYNRKINNEELSAIIYTVYGNNYLMLEVYSASVKYFHKTIQSAYKIPRKERRTYLINYAYSNIGDIYEKTGNEDSAYYYKKAAYKAVQDSYNTIQLANFFNDYKNNEDSARYYLNEATHKWGRKTDIYMAYTAFDESILYQSWGKFYEKKQDYIRSIDFYEKSLKKAIESNESGIILEAYQHLAEISQKKKDFAKATEYLTKATTIKDSINARQKKSLDISIQKFLDKTEAEYGKNKIRFYYVSIAFSLLLIILIYCIYRYFQEKKDIERQLEREKLVLAEKEEIIKSQEKQTKKLENKIKDGFDEVVFLAKKNKPEFIARFIEIYPEFYQALLKVYPDINPETLKFCALLKLNFSTKDIAEYNFITPRAIQLRKNRIRKKLNISSSEDIYAWMNNLEQNV